MIEYPKIETLYDRDERFKVTDVLRCPEFALPKEWMVTEKIDGMNARIGVSVGGALELAGRTDKASLTPDQLAILGEIGERAVEHFAETDVDVVLFGELYGPKIQSGGKYRSDIALRLFDVLVGPWWLEWDDVVDVAASVGVRTVPVIATHVPLEGALTAVRLPSMTAVEDGGAKLPSGDHEGIVARTVPQLFDRQGRRVQWKLKGRDFGKDDPR